MSDFALAHDLRLAILTNQLQLTLQPKVSLNTFDVVGHEALLCWKHASKGLIPADKWVAIAENHGLMPQLTLWLVNEIIHHIKIEDVDLPIAFNISPTCLTIDFAHQIINTLKRNNVQPSLIQVEITESTQIKNFNALNGAIITLKKEGIKVSLDDFGEGFTSLRSLVELEVDEIKIDKTFVQNDTKKSRLVLASLISLAKEINLSVVCEGIETQAQMNLAKKMGADQGQGYLFGRPVAVQTSKPKGDDRITA